MHKFKIALMAEEEKNSFTKKWVIDTDCGVDDAQAIMVALKYLDVVAITAVAGNVGAEQVATNASKVLEICKAEVPIFIGAEKPMLNELETLPSYHGKDGLGDHPRIKKMHGFAHCIDRSEKAYQALIRLSKEHGELNIIAIGPQTNITFALLRDPSFAQRVGEFRALGGTLNGTGLIDYNKERNYHLDPEAAHLVQTHIKKISLITWEVVHALKADRDLHRRMEQLLAKGGRKKRFL